MKRRTKIIYSLALVSAVALIATGFAIARQTRRELDDKLQQAKNRMKAEKAAGTLEPEMTDDEIDRLTLNNFGMTLPYKMQVRVDLTLWIEEFWYVLIPLVLVVCLGPAFFIDRLWRRFVARRL